MNKKSRTEYSVRNTTAAMVSRILAILMGFLTRVVFTHTLSEAYVGVNGLFSDILNVLSLSELGVGTAITYALYQPIAEENVEKQKSLMKMFQTFYRGVAAFVLVAGLLVIPFLGILMKEKQGIDHLILIYLMYLANSVVSYLLIYKRTLIDAHQLSYIGVIYQTIFLLIQDVVQIILLLTTHNFILFLTVYLICTLGNNLCISRRADQLYPFLKDKKAEPLPKEERDGIFKNIKAMLMHKISFVVINNTDNLLLTYFAGIISTGCYSNYYLVIGSVRQVLNQMFQGITASVGNLGVTEKKERVKKIFETSFFIGQWLFGFAAICLFELLNPFVEMSFGAKFLFSIDVVFVLCLNFYATGMRQATLAFRDSLGLFWFDRYKAVAEAVLNLVISIVLAQFYGTIGVFLGTLISTMLTFWIEPYMLYRHSLEAPVRQYFVKYLYYVLILGLSWGMTDFLCRQMTGGILLIFFKRLAVCLFLPNLFMLLAYLRMKELRFVMEKAKGILDARIRCRDKDTQNLR